MQGALSVALRRGRRAAVSGSTRAFAPLVVLLELCHNSTRARGGTHHLREQQLRLLGMVQALGKLVDVEQHRAQNVEMLVGGVARATIDHHGQGPQHGRQRGMFVADDAHTLACHGNTPLLFQYQAPASHLSVREKLIHVGLSP
jgi:hypothetical protein